MKALVIGGTGFIGKRLVKYLLDAGNEVTIGSSGRTANPFGDRVSHVTLNRFDPENLREKASKLPYFDVLYDQVGFGPDDVASICDAFNGRIGHYVFTSSASVYSSIHKVGRVEEDFNAASFEPKEGGIKNLGYAEGKKSAECYLYRHAPFPYAAVRFMIVVGHDDVTGRFQFHVDRVLEGKRIVIPTNCKKMNYVWVEDAGRFLAWIGMNKKTGPYNAASSYMLDAREIVSRIGKAVGREPVISDEGNEEDKSPYYTETAENISCEKAEKEGFEFTAFDKWFPEEVKNVLVTGGERANTMKYLQEKLKEGSV